MRVLIGLILILILHSISAQVPPRHIRNVDSAVLSWNLINYHDADDLADTLTSSFDNDSEKVRAIYFWVTQYISYDLKKYEGNMDISLEVNKDIDKDGNLDEDKMIRHTLYSKRGVCEDYADLFAYMCNSAKIKCEVIEGLVSTGSSWLTTLTGGSDHAWDAVMINNKWYLIDPTWASGYIDGNRFKRKRNDYYYLTPPNEFIKDHYPYDSQWQLLNPPVSKATFNKGG